MITLIPVQSRNLVAIGHDPIANVMHVKFKDGSIYEYRDVTAHEHVTLLGASSLGAHFHANFRPRTAKRIA